MLFENQHLGSTWHLESSFSGGSSFKVLSATDYNLTPVVLGTLHNISVYPSFLSCAVALIGSGKSKMLILLLHFWRSLILVRSRAQRDFPWWLLYSIDLFKLVQANYSCTGTYSAVTVTSLIEPFAMGVGVIIWIFTSSAIVSNLFV